MQASPSIQDETAGPLVPAVQREPRTVKARVYPRSARRIAVSAPVPRPGPHAAWLVPIRDLLSLGVRIASYRGTTVKWREQMLTMRENSRIRDAR